MDQWLFDSDVCKHCTNAGCLDACPTGALIRTEFETVIVQTDICNGCGYCVPACPFGVIDRDPYDGRAAKCTLCYDRLQDGMEPACAKACPTDSIQFGPYDELVERAKGRVAELHARGVDTAYLYGAGDEGADQLAGGLGAFFLLTEPPERFGLPAQADSPIQANVPVATAAGLAAGVTAAAVAVVSLLVAHRRRAMSHGRKTPPEQRIREREARVIDGRDVTPGGRPPRRAGALAARRASGCAASSRASRTRAGRSCTATAATRLRPTDEVREAARRMRGGTEVPVEVKGPMLRPNVWTWEVPAYFWFGGIATGASFAALACQARGRRALGARGADGGGRRRRPRRAAADPRPRPARALPAHVPDLQAALADVDGRVVPDARS